MNLNHIALALIIPAFLVGQASMLERPTGKIAYTLHGEGSTLVIAIPGIGENQDQYRFMIPLLVSAGYQVATVDLRGHGESSLNWPDYSSAANGEDIVALIDELGAEAVVLVGNSIGGAASVWVAAERPDAVKGIVMINPFVEDAKLKWYEKTLYRAAFARPWGKGTWMKFYEKNYPTRRPDDFDEHLATLDAMLSRPGGYGAFNQTLWSSHARAATRIDEVKAPVKVIIGSRDPDFKNPEAEMNKLKEMFKGDGSMIEGAGHYPHVEFPSQTGEIMVKYINGVMDGTKS